MMYPNSLEKVDEDVLVEEEILLDEELADTGVGNAAQLVVYNDDHNTFDWVIQCFQEVLQQVFWLVVRAQEVQPTPILFMEIT